MRHFARCLNNQYIIKISNPRKVYLCFMRIFSWHLRHIRWIAQFIWFRSWMESESSAMRLMSCSRKYLVSYMSYSVSLYSAIKSPLFVEDSQCSLKNTWKLCKFNQSSKEFSNFKTWFFWKRFFMRNILRTNKNVVCWLVKLCYRVYKMKKNMMYSPSV